MMKYECSYTLSTGINKGWLVSYWIPENMRSSEEQNLIGRQAAGEIDGFSIKEIELDSPGCFPGL